MIWITGMTCILQCLLPGLIFMKKTSNMWKKLELHGTEDWNTVWWDSKIMDFYHLNFFRSIGKCLEDRKYKCYTSLEITTSIRLNKGVVLKFHLHHLSVFVVLSNNFNGSDSAPSPNIWATTTAISSPGWNELWKRNRNWLYIKFNVSSSILMDWTEALQEYF